MRYYIRAKVKDGGKLFLQGTGSSGDMYSERPEVRNVRTVTWIRERDVPDLKEALKTFSISSFEVWAFTKTRHNNHELTATSTARAIKWSYENKKITAEKI